jgi:hypothetical protein
MTMSIRPRTSVGAVELLVDALVAHRMDRDAERSDRSMNALATFYVNQHMQDLLDEAARNRIRRAGQPSRTRRIASALQSLRQAMSRRQALPA